jgi:hypothetical protein
MYARGRFHFLVNLVCLLWSAFKKEVEGVFSALRGDPGGSVRGQSWLIPALRVIAWMPRL